MRPTLFALMAFFLPCVCAAEAAPIGRLFSTPAERTALDRLRQTGEQPIAVDDKPAAIVAPPEPVTEQITLDGFVRRSSGKGTTWINQIPRNEQEISQGIRVRQQLSKPPAVSIWLPSGKRIDLKAGQTFDGVSGKVSEVFDVVPEAAPPKIAK